MSKRTNDGLAGKRPGFKRAGKGQKRKGGYMRRGRRGRY